MDWELFIDVLRNSILITGLVLIMMLMIEYFNIQSRGQWFTKLQGSQFKQILLGSVLGLIPGCIGGFAAVSLFTHRLISFGALVAMMICSSGDEAFVILAMIPEQGLILFAILFVIAIITGLIIDKVICKKPQIHLCTEGYEIHKNADNAIPSIFKASSYKVMKHPSKERIAILAGIAVFIATVAGGFLEHDHAHIEGEEGHIHLHETDPHAHTCETSQNGQINTDTQSETHQQEHTTSCCPQDHHHATDIQPHNQAHQHQQELQHATDIQPQNGQTHQHQQKHNASLSEQEHHTHSGLHHHGHPETGSFNLLNERWINFVFAIFSIVTLLFTATAKEHFVKEHLWNHVIKKHLFSIFLWTFGALLVCQIGIRYLDIQHWINQNLFLVMLLAVGIGIIPESGPHLVFVTLFAQGVLPFYILLVNSIVQDGHTTLPLLAESKTAFFKAKLINIVVGLIVGLICWGLL